MWPPLIHSERMWLIFGSVSLEGSKQWMNQIVIHSGKKNQLNSIVAQLAFLVLIQSANVTGKYQGHRLVYNTRTWLPLRGHSVVGMKSIRSKFATNVSMDVNGPDWTSTPSKDWTSTPLEHLEEWLEHLEEWLEHLEEWLGHLEEWPVHVHQDTDCQLTTEVAPRKRTFVSATSNGKKTSQALPQTLHLRFKIDLSFSLRLISSSSSTSHLNLRLILVSVLVSSDSSSSTSYSRFKIDLSFSLSFFSSSSSTSHLNGKIDLPVSNLVSSLPVPQLHTWV